MGERERKGLENKKMLQLIETTPEREGEREKEKDRGEEGAKERERGARLDVQIDKQARPSEVEPTRLLRAISFVLKSTEQRLSCFSALTLSFLSLSLPLPNCPAVIFQPVGQSEKQVTKRKEGGRQEKVAPARSR